MRVRKENLAEKALKEVVRKCFCFFAYEKLFEVCAKNKNVGNTVGYLEDFVEDLNSFGVKNINKIPQWLENNLVLVF